MTASTTTTQPSAFPDDYDRTQSPTAHQIRLSGVRNFRDLGGYPTRDGRMVRHGLLYRSASLQGLTPRDLRILAVLSIQKIIDFRSEAERTRHPDRIPADPAIQLVNIPILDSSTAATNDLERGSRGLKLDGIDPAALLTTTNIELASQFTPEYRQFAREVLEANGEPLLFHCAAGKDRTGFAAAILLRVLGVPQELILQDYLLSNRYYRQPMRAELMLVGLLRGRETARVVAGFVEVRPAFLAAAFDTIDRSFGSFEDYIHHGLCLTSHDVDSLKLAYLQPGRSPLLEHQDGAIQIA